MAKTKSHKKRNDAQMPKLTQEQLAKRIDMVVRKAKRQQESAPGEDVIGVDRGRLFHHRMRAVRVG